MWSAQAKASDRGGFVLRPPLWLRLLGTAALSPVIPVLGVGGLGDGGFPAWLGPIAAALWLCVVIRNWRLRVLVMGETLQVVNIFSTRHIALRDVHQVVNEPGQGVIVRLKSGWEVPVTAFAHPTGALPSVDRRNAAAARRLQAAVRARRRR